MKVEIAVITHKKCPIPRDDMYRPVLAGAALLNPDDPVFHNNRIQRDDVGDNISHKNKLYCELTGLYWMWKHSDADYIGLVHYRRYFGSLSARRPLAGEYSSTTQRIVGREEIEELLKDYRIIVPTKRRYFIETLFSHYEHTHYEEHLRKTRQIIGRLCPVYLSVYDDVLKQKWGYMFNMAVMPRDLLDRYCSWLFPILYELEKVIDISTLSPYNARYVGRVAELIFNVWLQYQMKNRDIAPSEIRELPMLMIDKVNWISKGIRFLKAKFLHIRYEA